MLTPVFFDIETIPSRLQWVHDYYDKITEEPTPPKSLKKQETIDAWKAENTKEEAVQKALDKAGFSGATNHIVCISWAIGKGETKSAYVGHDLSEERRAIKEFFDDISQSFGLQFVGHNIIGFDLPVIKQRAMVLGVPIPSNFPLDVKPWDKEVYDTMLKWESGYGKSVKMDLLAQAFGIQGKGNIDGSMVYPMWKEGRIAEIAEYCEDDVRMTREIFDRMRFIMPTPEDAPHNNFYVQNPLTGSSIEIPETVTNEESE